MVVKEVRRSHEISDAIRYKWKHVLYRRFTPAFIFGERRVTGLVMVQAEQKISVFVIGGVVAGTPSEVSRMRSIACRLGASLGASGKYRVVACSAHESSLDAGVIEGFAGTNGDKEGALIVHCPSDHRDDVEYKDSIRGQWEALVNRTGLSSPLFRENSSARVTSNDDFPRAFLACQIRALRDDTHIVVAVGGKSASSASNLLSIAHGRLPIASFATLGGAANQEFERQERELRRKILDQGIVDALQASDGIDRIDEIITKLLHVHSPFRVFISYAWEARESADYVEAYLRRDTRVSVFRDEVDIRSGEGISERVMQAIADCDVFLILWSQAYAASPWCRDEFKAAAERDGGQQYYVLRLDDTRPSWEEFRTEKSQEWERKWLPAQDRESIATSLEEMLKLSERPR